METDGQSHRNPNPFARSQPPHPIVPNAVPEAFSISESQAVQAAAPRQVAVGSKPMPWQTVYSQGGGMIVNPESPLSHASILGPL